MKSLLSGCKTCSDEDGNGHLRSTEFQPRIPTSRDASLASDSLPSATRVISLRVVSFGAFDYGEHFWRRFCRIWQLFARACG